MTSVLLHCCNKNVRRDSVNVLIGVYIAMGPIKLEVTTTGEVIHALVPEAYM